jgi:hypothetical protein
VVIDAIRNVCRTSLIDPDGNLFNSATEGSDVLVDAVE